MRTGKTVDVEGSIKNTGTEEVYLFVKVDMPATRSFEGVYEINTVTGWDRIVSGEDQNDGTRWIEVYVKSEPIRPGERVTLANKIKMKDIEVSEYVDMDDLDMTWQNFGCSSEEMEYESAWNQIGGMSGRDYPRRFYISTDLGSICD